MDKALQQIIAKSQPVHPRLVKELSNVLDSSAFGVFPSADVQKIQAVFNELGKRDSVYFVVAQKINKRNMITVEGLLREFLDQQISMASVGKSSSPVEQGKLLFTSRLQRDTER